MSGPAIEDLTHGANDRLRRRYATVHSRADSKKPVVLLLTRDAAFGALVARACASCCVVEQTGSGDACLKTAQKDNADLVVMDDDALPEDEREWFMRRVGRLLPQPSIIYVASKHSAAVEREARACGAAYYTSKPVDAQSMDEVLHAWARHLLERDRAASLGGVSVSRAH